MVTKQSDIFVSTVFVVDQYSSSAAAKIKSLAEILKKNYSNYEILIIDNGSVVKERRRIMNLLPTTACLRVIQLSKQYDTDTAIFAGVDSAIGDYICILYSSDPIDMVPIFIEKATDTDIVFGIATNLKRHSLMEEIGARLFYWYSRRYLQIDIPRGATYFICMDRPVANALTNGGRHLRHIRQMAKQVGFVSANLKYQLPADGRLYASHKRGSPILRAIDLISNYSRHPLRLITYLGIFAGFLNILYAIYVVIISISLHDVAKGWTTLSLQSSFMFFILFIVMAVLAEYIGRILEESRDEPPYNIVQELSSTISIADETRRNVTK